jgi:hypothetical protein
LLRKNLADEGLADGRLGDIGGWNCGWAPRIGVDPSVGHAAKIGESGTKAALASKRGLVAHLQAHGMTCPLARIARMDFVR